MYKTAVRHLVRRAITGLNRGDPRLLLRLASRDVTLAFPGANSWAAMYRPVVRSRHPHVTHSGIDECRGFAERFIDEGLHLEVEDVLVDGPPWRTRVAVRAHDFLAGADGDEYANRVVLVLEARWGRLLGWEAYEDTERITEWDRRRGRTGDG